MIRHLVLLRFADKADAARRAELAADRGTYLPHPQHLAFVERLKPWLADVLVIDYEWNA